MFVQLVYVFLGVYDFLIPINILMNSGQGEGELLEHRLDFFYARFFLFLDHLKCVVHWVPFRKFGIHGCFPTGIYSCSCSSGYLCVVPCNMHSDCY